jgi:hypothetical protein
MAVGSKTLGGKMPIGKIYKCDHQVYHPSYQKAESTDPKGWVFAKEQPVDGEQRLLIMELVPTIDEGILCFCCPEHLAEWIKQKWFQPEVKEATE